MMEKNHIDTDVTILSDLIGEEVVPYENPNLVCKILMVKIWSGYNEETRERSEKGIDFYPEMATNVFEYEIRDSQGNVFGRVERKGLFVPLNMREAYYRIDESYMQVFINK